MANEPMIKLESGGQAPILSYYVAESANYSGRNYIDLGLNENYFNKRFFENNIDILLDSGISSASANPSVGITKEKVREVMKTGKWEDLFPNLKAYSGLFRFEERGSKLELVSNERVSAKLRNLNPDEIFTMVKVGKSLNIYRSLYGDYTYEFLEKPKQLFISKSGKIAQPLLIARKFARGDINRPPRFSITDLLTLTITSPTTGTTISGDSAGVEVEFGGTVNKENSQKVFVQIGDLKPSSQPQEANIDTNGTSWSLKYKFETSGKFIVSAWAQTNSGVSEIKSVEIEIVLVPQGSDKIPPIITITDPSQDNVVLISPLGRMITVKGTAADSDGVESVELTLDNDLSAYVSASRDKSDWSIWRGKKLINEPGPHSITARCRDKAGNISETTINIEARIVNNVTRLLLVEEYRLSSFLGNYGAGKVIKTFSLLPGEKTKISIKTFTRSEEDRKQTSNIFDSFTQDSADDFENSIAKEQTNQQEYNESKNYKISAEANTGWGWGSAAISAETTSSSNAAREDFAKNITSAVQKHASKTSAKRDIQINTSYEEKEISEEQTFIERDVENINFSRTLNFVFRQMNQEFISLLHLVDVKVGFYNLSFDVNGEPVYTYKEATLPMLDSLLSEILIEDEKNRMQEVRENIINILSNIIDYNYKLHIDFIKVGPEKDCNNKDDVPGTNYLRVNRKKVSEYTDPVTNSKKAVPGIIISESKNVIRTEGIIVEALLGEGEALDRYARKLQEFEIKRREADVERLAAEASRQSLINEFASRNAKDEASVLTSLMYTNSHEHSAVNINVNAKENGGE